VFGRLKIVGCVTAIFEGSTVLPGVFGVIVLGGDVVLSVVGAGGIFGSNGLFVAKGFNSISGISCFLPLLPDKILEILG